jgi:hypothetical protein
MKLLAILLLVCFGCCDRPEPKVFLFPTPYKAGDLIYTKRTGRIIEIDHRAGGTWFGSELKNGLHGQRWAIRDDQIAGKAIEL